MYVAVYPRSYFDFSHDSCEFSFLITEFTSSIYELLLSICSLSSFLMAILRVTFSLAINAASPCLIIQMSIIPKFFISIMFWLLVGRLLSPFWLIMIIDNSTDMKNGIIFKGVEPVYQLSRPHSTTACPVRETEQIIAIQNMVDCMSNSVWVKIFTFNKVINLLLDRVYPLFLNIIKSILPPENDSVIVSRSKQTAKERVFAILEIGNTLTAFLIV
nr:MAG TPA: hypothetical protein [Caudoviricetes sp.]